SRARALTRRGLHRRPATASRIPRTGLGSGRGGRGLLERELAVLGVDHDRVALAELVLEQALRQRVLDLALDRALQRPGAVSRIPAGIRDQLLRRRRQHEVDAALREAIADPVELQLDDVAELVARERLELDDLVDPVQELGPEEVAQSVGRAQV